MAVIIAVLALLGGTDGALALEEPIDENRRVLDNHSFKAIDKPQRIPGASEDAAPAGRREAVRDEEPIVILTPLPLIALAAAVSIAAWLAVRRRRAASE